MSVEGFCSRVRQFTEHFFKNFCFQRLSVRPAQVFPEAEGPFESVVRDAPFPGASGCRISVLIKYHESLTDQFQQACGICIHSLCRDRVSGFARQMDPDHFVLFAGSCILLKCLYGSLDFFRRCCYSLGSARGKNRMVSVG